MRMLVVTLAVSVLICTGAQAEPDEATKRAALLWAYQANGNSMTAWTAWDYEKRQRIDFFPRDVATQPKQEPKQK